MKKESAKVADSFFSYHQPSLSNYLLYLPLHHITANTWK